MSDVQALLSAKQVRLAEIKEINARLQKLGVDTTPKKTKKIVVSKGKTATTVKPKAKPKQVPIVATVNSMKLYLTLQDVKYNAAASKAELESIIRENFMV